MRDAERINEKKLISSSVDRCNDHNDWTDIRVFVLYLTIVFILQKYVTMKNVIG